MKNTGVDITIRFIRKAFKRINVNVRIYPRVWRVSWKMCDSTRIICASPGHHGHGRRKNIISILLFMYACWWQQNLKFRRHAFSHSPCDVHKRKNPFHAPSTSSKGWRYFTFVQVVNTIGIVVFRCGFLCSSCYRNAAVDVILLVLRFLLRRDERNINRDLLNYEYRIFVQPKRIFFSK